MSKKFARDLIEVRQSFQEVRPAAQRRPSGSVVLATDWRVVSQATPAVVPAARPTTIRAFSNATSYDSTTLGFKTIIKFPHFVLASGKSAMLRPASAAFDNLVDSFTFPAAFICGLSAVIRVRPITAEFDAAAVTWNNSVAAPTLTYGANICEESVYIESATTPTFSVQSWSRASRATLAPRLVGPLDLYGFIIDVRATLAFNNPSSISINWSSEVLLDPLAPYIIKF